MNRNHNHQTFRGKLFFIGFISFLLNLGIQTVFASSDSTSTDFDENLQFIGEETQELGLLMTLTEKQNEEIEALKNEKARLVKNDAFRHAFTYILVVMILVLLIAFFTYYRSFKLEKINLGKLKKQKLKIEYQAAELDKLNLLKDKIFSILAHDLKGPLSSLQEMVRLIQEKDLTQQEFESYLPILSKNLNNNSILLENLLAWSRSQMKGMEVKLATINLKEVVDNNLEFLSQSSFYKGQSLLNLIPESAIVEADHQMLDIVLRNLITNALKFTRPGDEIIMSVKEHQNTYTICVRDEGVGIREDNLKKLFGNEFFSTAGTEKEAGTGLGLLLSKELVLINRGDIWAESEIGKGSTFCFTLPKI